MRSSGAFLVVALMLAVVAGCADEAPSITPSTTPSPVATPTATDPAGSLVPTAVDPALLDILPPDADGRERRDDPETAAEIAADPGLQGTVEAVALALYADTESYVVTTVSRLRPGVFDETFYRDWRDTFDAAVCEQAGGVDLGHGEVEIDGRLVFRSSCVGGIVIQHLHLDEPVTLLSLQGAGPVDLGVVVLDDLRLE